MSATAWRRLRERGAYDGLLRLSLASDVEVSVYMFLILLSLFLLGSRQLCTQPTTPTSCMLRQPMNLGGVLTRSLTKAISLMFISHIMSAIGKSFSSSPKGCSNSEVCVCV